MNTKFIVVVGDDATGKTFYGVFETENDANGWISYNVPSYLNSCVAPLESPESTVDEFGDIIEGEVTAIEDTPSNLIKLPISRPLEEEPIINRKGHTVGIQTVIEGV